MTKQNPYRLTAKVLKGIGFTALGLFYAVAFGILVWALWLRYGWWTLLIFPGGLVGIVAIMIIVALIGVGFGNLGRWWRKRAREWERNHDSE